MSISEVLELSDMFFYANICKSIYKIEKMCYNKLLLYKYIYR